MFARRLVRSMVPVFFVVTAAAYGQTVHEHEIEEIKSPNVPLAQDAKRADLAATVQRIVQETNRFRQEMGREPVAPNRALMQTAADFASFMAKTNKYGHTADGNQPNDRAAKHGYEYCVIAENIAYAFNSRGFTTEELASNFVEGWKHSPPHRKNMLDPDVIETGVGVAQSPETGYYYAVQMFGRPKSKAITFRIANESGTTVEYRIGDRTFPLPPDYVRTHTSCRRVDLRFDGTNQKPQSDANAQLLHPADGDRYVVFNQNGEIRIKKQ
jgi:uncharacterized protein YkwD